MESSRKGRRASTVFFTEKRKMSESPQQTGLSVKQWCILLFAFLIGVATVSVLDMMIPVQGSSNQVVQAATGNH